jgi:Chromate transport protein ChrA
MIYLQLFITFFKIGLFTFGGGYAMISLIQNEVVVTRGWIDAASFTDIIAVSQMTPGPIGINSATYIGYTVTGGFLGISGGNICSMPAIIYYYTAYSTTIQTIQKNRWFNAALTGIRPVIPGLIASAAITLVTPDNFIDWKSWILFAAAFAAVQWGKKSPILLILLGAAAGLIIY